MLTYLFIHISFGLLFCIIVGSLNLSYLKNEPLKRINDYILRNIDFPPLHYYPNEIISNKIPYSTFSYSDTTPMHPPLELSSIIIKNLVTGLMLGPLSIIPLITTLASHFNIQNSVDDSDLDIIYADFIAKVNEAYDGNEEIEENIKAITKIQNESLRKFVQYNLRFFEVIHMVKYYTNVNATSCSLLKNDATFLAAREKFLGFIYSHLKKITNSNLS